MNLRLLKNLSFASAAAFAAVIFSSSAFAKIERNVEKTFSVSSDVTLSVETSAGNVRVESGDVQSVRVVARQIFPKAKTDAEADEIAKSLTLVIEQSGNTVTASAKYTKKGWGNTPVYVAFDVTVPRACTVDLKTSGGDISVTDINGTAKARTSGGNISLGKINGVVDARTSGGDVKLASSTKDATLGTSGGDVTSGPVDGDLKISTSGGNIKIDGAAGALNASTSGGNIKAQLGNVTKECVLSTSGGNVSVRIAPVSNVQLDASTSGGRVKVDGLQLATILSGGNGKNKLSANINGGGQLLKLRTSGGNIDVAAE